MPCDMDPINAIARKHKLAVVEDACQAWLAEYKGRKCGTLGDLACFSFQNSKHLPSGEGGAVTGNSDDLLDRCHAFHNVGRATGSFKGKRPYFTRGSNYRMQHFQAMILLQQFDKLVEETARRCENAEYLTSQLKEIPGIQPARLPENIRALGAEGIPSSSVYHEQYFDGLLDEAINSRGFKRLFSAQRLKTYRDSFQELKGNRQVCETTVGMTQNLLLAERRDIDHIVEAIRKIQKHSAALAKATV
jgi:perosamine synthetase